MSWRQLQAWRVYYSLEPWGEDRADLRAAHVAFETLRVTHAGKKQFRAEDFILKMATGGPNVEGRAPSRDPEPVTPEKWGSILSQVRQYVGQGGE